MADIIPQEIDSTAPPDALIPSDAKPCPKCSSAQRTRRVPRPLWMRLFPSSLNMVCGHCGHRFWLMS